MEIQMIVVLCTFNRSFQCKKNAFTPICTPNFQVALNYMTTYNKIASRSFFHKLKSKQTPGISDFFLFFRY